MNEAAVELARRTAARLRPDGATVVAVAGPVAVGKSVLADALAHVLRDTGTGAEVVSTDGFLLPNAELGARGLGLRKGFPESYDGEALRAFVTTVRAGRDPASVPVYSHETYDVVPGAARVVGPTDVVVLEGVNALSATVGLADFGVYVDADEVVVERWYVERFVGLAEAAAPGSFYARFGGLDRAALEDLAREVHRSINVVNLREHIAPSRVHAHVVVEKTADHRVGAIREREEP